MDGWKCRARCCSVSLSLLSCPNLFCLINSFYPSGCSDSSGCAARPTSQQPLLSSPLNSLSLSLSFYCTFLLLLLLLLLYLLAHLLGRSPLSTRPNSSSSEETEQACCNYGNRFNRRPQKVQTLDLRSVAPLSFLLYMDRQQKMTQKTPHFIYIFIHLDGFDLSE